MKGMQPLCKEEILENRRARELWIQENTIEKILEASSSFFQELGSELGDYALWRNLRNCRLEAGEGQN